MTDLERAREILAGYPLETAQHVIAEALAAARREGTQGALEAVLPVSPPTWFCEWWHAWCDRQDEPMSYCADAWEALCECLLPSPLTPEEPT